MPKKILLADDSITIQKVVELTFSDGDYEVVATNNGNKAIQRLGEVRPDIILSDIIMPEKNGYELCEYVKSHPDYRHIPVILLTGTFEPFDPDRAEKAGCDAVITKPFESQSLIHKVEELIEQSGSGAKAVSTAQASPAESRPMKESPSFGASSEDETRAFPPPKIDLGWSAKTPAEPESVTAPAASATQPAAPMFASTAFEEHGGKSAAGSASEKSSPPPLFDEPSDSGTTKAFPKMSFQDIQRPEVDTGAFPKMDFDDLPKSPVSSGEAFAGESVWPSSEPSRQAAPFSDEPITPDESSESLFDAGRTDTWPTSPAPTTPPVSETRGAESPSSAASSDMSGKLSQEEIDQIAKRVVELMSEQVVKNIAWEVIPDLAEMIVRERIKQLENEA